MSSFCISCRENVEFYERDGLYYCSLCDVQSETMQVMEYNLMDSQPSQSMSTPFSRNKAIKVSSSAKRKAHVLSETDGEASSQGTDSSDSWWIAEVFQIILQAQVKTLIDMGVTPKLEDVVRNLWFKYLQNSNWAFVRQSKKEKLRTEGENKKKTNDLQTETDTSAKSKKIRPGDASMYDGGQSKSPFRLPHLLCILYLGLRWLRQPILLSDLIRWVLEGHLPFCANSDLIPDNIERNFTMRENNIFCLFRPNVLKSSKFVAPMAHIYSILDPPPIPPQDLNRVIQRFIVVLNLPASFHKYAHRLVMFYPTKMADKPPKPQNRVGNTSSRKRKRLPFTEEAPSLAYIVMTIKLLVGLDDKTECTLSEVGRKIRSFFPADSGVVPFIWDEWVAAQRLRMKEHQHDINHFSPQDARRVGDTSRFISHHAKMVQLKAKQNHIYADRRYKAKSLHEILQRPFNSLRSAVDSDEDNGGVDAAGSRPTCFPYSHLVQDRDMSAPDEQVRVQDTTRDASDDVSNVGQLNGVPMVHWLSKRDLYATDFSLHSTAYLVNLKRFCKAHGISLGVENLENDEGFGRTNLDNGEELRMMNHENGDDSGAVNTGDIAEAGVADNSRVCWPDHNGNLLHESSIESFDEAVAKATATLDRLTEEEVENLSYEEWRARILAGTKENEEKKQKKQKNNNNLVATLDNEKRKKKKKKQKNVAEMGENEKRRKKKKKKQCILAGKEDTDMHMSENKKTTNKWKSSVSGGPSSYVRYNEQGFHQLQLAHERDGIAPEGTFRPFHASYQWLLEHCAALFGVEWIDIHQAVLNLESIIFGDEGGDEGGDVAKRRTRATSSKTKMAKKNKVKEKLNPRQGMN